MTTARRYAAAVPPSVYRARERDIFFTRREPPFYRRRFVSRHARTLSITCAHETCALIVFVLCSVVLGCVVRIGARKFNTTAAAVLLLPSFSNTARRYRRRPTLQSLFATVYPFCNDYYKNPITSSRIYAVCFVNQKFRSSFPILCDLRLMCVLHDVWRDDAIVMTYGLMSLMLVIKQCIFLSFLLSDI